MFFMLIKTGTRVTSTRRRTPPPRIGLVGMQFVCQFSSATVTNPGLNPVETNAKLRGYHLIVNPSTKD
jgi:hypothetical protein